MPVNTAQRENIVLYEGAAFTQTYQWVEDDEVTPISLAGYTALMHVRNKISDDSPLITLTESDADGGIIISATPEDGCYTISITATDTTGICPRHKVVVGVYDLRFSLAGVVLYQQYGTATMKPAVTRPAEA